MRRGFHHISRGELCSKSVATGVHLGLSCTYRQVRHPVLDRLPPNRRFIDPRRDGAGVENLFILSIGRGVGGGEGATVVVISESWPYPRRGEKGE